MLPWCYRGRIPEKAGNEAPPTAPRSARGARTDETTGPRDAPLHRTPAEPNVPLQDGLHEERRPDSWRYETALGGVAQVTSRRQRWAAGGARKLRCTTRRECHGRQNGGGSLALYLAIWSRQYGLPVPRFGSATARERYKNLFVPVLNMMSATWTVSELRFGEQSKRSDEQRAHIPSNFGHLITHAIWKGFYSDMCREESILRLK